MEPDRPSDPLLRACLAACAIAGALLLASPAPATAASYGIGTAARPFSLSSASGVIVTGAASDQSLQLPYTVLWQYASPGLDPRSATKVATDTLLVADGNGRRAFELSPGGLVLWSFSAVDDPLLARPTSAYRVPDTDHTLVCDNGSRRVVEVTHDASPTIVWTWGTGAYGTGPGQLADPVSAVRLPDGHTLICDAEGGNRVIEVATSTPTPLWQYGQSGVAGTGDGFLVSPRSAQRLNDGNTLIADAGSHMVIEVSHDATPVVAWRYGTTVAGSGPNQLNAPTFAERLPNGDTLIFDSGNRRVIEVDEAGAIVSSYGTGTAPDWAAIGGTGGVTRLADGSTLVADPANARLFSYGVAPSGSAILRATDCGAPGVTKRLTALVWNADAPAGASVALDYSIDGGRWRSAGAGPILSLPSTAEGVLIAFRVRMTSGAWGAMPRLRDITVQWQVAGTSSGTSGTGSGSDRGTGSGSGSGAGSGSGSYGFPSGDGPIYSSEASADQGPQVLRGWVMSKTTDAGPAGGSATLGLTGASRKVTASTYAGLGLLAGVFVLGMWSAPIGKVPLLAARLISTTKG